MYFAAKCVIMMMSEIDDLSFLLDAVFTLTLSRSTLRLSLHTFPSSVQETVHVSVVTSQAMKVYES